MYKRQPESSGGTESQSASAEESSGAEPPELSGELVVMTLAGEPFVPAWQDQAAVFTEQTGVCLLYTSFSMGFRLSMRSDDVCDT